MKGLARYGDEALALGDEAAGGGKGIWSRIRERLPSGDDGIVAMGRYSPDQDAAIQLAKDAKRRGGISMEDANVLVDWADELDLIAHGPQIHPRRSGFGGTVMQINVGPVKHIPVR